MSKLSSASVKITTPLPSTQSFWAKGPPSPSQSPAPSHVASTKTTSRSRRPSALRQGGSVNDGISVPLNSLGSLPGSVVFGSIDDASASSPAVIKTEVVGSVPPTRSRANHVNGKTPASVSGSSKPARLALSSAPSNSSAPSSTIASPPKPTKADIAKLFQNSSSSQPSSDTSSPSTRPSPHSSSQPPPQHSKLGAHSFTPFVPGVRQSQQPVINPRSPAFPRAMPNMQAQSRPSPQAGSGDSSGPTIPASPRTSPLLTARVIENLSEVTYPEGIKSPKIELNANVRDGRFRYDRDFLMQFMHVCKEKPPTLAALGVLGIEPVDLSSARGSSGAMPPPSEIPQRRTSPQDLASAKTNVSAPHTSALLTARVIENLSQVVYPEGIKGPKVELNANVRDGRFRYDRDFLMQFMHVCKEKPPTLAALDVLGIEPVDPLSFAMAGSGSGRPRKKKPLMPASATHPASVGLGIGGSQKPSIPSPFQMGNFQSPGGKKLTSEERFPKSSTVPSAPTSSATALSASATHPASVGLGIGGFQKPSMPSPFQMGNFQSPGGKKLTGEERLSSTVPSAPTSSATAPQFNRSPMVHTPGQPRGAPKKRVRTKRGEKRGEPNKSTVSQVEQGQSEGSAKDPVNATST